MRHIMFTRLPPSPGPPTNPITVTVQQHSKMFYNHYLSSLCCKALPFLPPLPLCMLIIIPPFFFPALSLLMHPSSPVPFPLVPVSPFLDSVIPLLFCSFQFFLCSYTTQMSEIIWYFPFSPWLISLSIIPSSSIHVVANGRICFLPMAE